MQKAIPIISKKFLIVLIGVMLVASMILFISPGKIYGASTLEVGVGKAYTTIQSAIDAASPGDTISVEAGVYNESLVITKSINLIGENKNTTQIKGVAGKWDVIDVKSTNNVTISGFTLNANNKAAECGIWIQYSSNIIIENNVFINFEEDAIFLGFSSDNNILRSNNIMGSSNAIIAGINIYDDSGNNLIENNTITLPTSSGSVTKPYCIYFSGNNSKNNTIQNNTGNGGSRFFQQDPGVIGTATIKGNKINNPTFAGISLNGGSAIITENELKNCVRPIEFWGAINGDISKNSIDGSTFDAINIGSFTGSVNISGNNSFANLPVGPFAVNNRTAVVIDALNNWWGAASGPYHPLLNASGTGFAVSDNVNFNPWLINPVGYVPPTPPPDGGTITAVPAITVLGITEGGSIADFVTQRCYRSILLREPDAAGLAGWVDAMTNGGLTGSDTAKGFIYSDELKLYLASLDNTGYLNFLYSRVLGRAADLPGLNGWLADMSSGMTKEEVLDYFLSCPEWFAICNAYGVTP